jgi:hypothetical protein
LKGGYEDCSRYQRQAQEKVQRRGIQKSRLGKNDYEDCSRYRSQGQGRRLKRKIQEGRFGKSGCGYFPRILAKLERRMA